MLSVANVINDCKSEHVIHRIIEREVPGLLANDNCKLALPVDSFMYPWNLLAAGQDR